MCARSGRPQPVLRRVGDEGAYANALLRSTYAFAPDSAPTFSGRGGERRGGVMDTVRAAIEHSFRASANPRNVLCKGMCRRVERRDGGVRGALLSGSTEVSVRCSTSAYEAFKSPVWETFCDRVGDDMFLHILLYCSVFVRVGTDRDTPLLQICGYPMNDSSRKRAITTAMATSKTRAGIRRERRARKRRQDEEAAENCALETDSTMLESKCMSEKPLTANPFISHIDVKEVIRLSDVYRCSQDVSVDGDGETSGQTSEEVTLSPASTEYLQTSRKRSKSYRKPSWLRKREARLNSTHAQSLRTREVKQMTAGNVVNRQKNASLGNEVKLADEVFDRGVFMFRSSFTKKPGLPATHTLRSIGLGVRASRRLYLTIFKAKKLTKATSKHKTDRALRQAKSTYRIPQKHRDTLLPTLRAMLDKVRCCPFTNILNKHAPMPRELMVSTKRVGELSQESLLSAYTAPRRVAAFVWEVIERVVPVELLGSVQTRKSLYGCIRRIVSLRRYERFTLHEVMQGIRTADFKCFKAKTTNASNAGQVEASQRRMVTKWISWLVQEMVFPIIRCHFYATDTQTHKNRIFFYRKGIWSRLVTATLQSLEETSFKRLTAKEVTAMMDRSNASNLGFSNMRFLPKGSGLRPLATLNKPTTFVVKGGGKNSMRRLKKFDAINRRLKDVQDILHHETVRDPNVLGAAVGDYKAALLRLGPCLRAIRRQKLLGRRPQAYILATDIKGAFDNLPLESLERVALDLISSSSYQTLHYAVVKQNGEAKYKKLVSSLPTAAKGERVPGPLVTEAQRVSNTGGAAILGRESRNSIVIDAGFAKEISDENIVPLLRAHLRENIISARGKFLLQTVGIPQGSIVSPLLCSLFYGHLEHEYGLLSGFCGEQSTVCRWMDDMLLVTTDLDRAKAFVDMCKKGFEAHGCTLNTTKTLSNFDHGEDVRQRTFVNADGRSYIPWCGILIDCLTLEIMVDYSRYSGEFVRESMNLPLGRKAWTRLPERICGFLKPKCAAIFFDESINSKVTVRVNVYQLFLMAAMKTHSYVAATSAIPGCEQISSLALYRAIKHAVRFGQILIQRQSSSARAHCGSVGRLPDSHVEFLAIQAFLKVLQQKQTRYKRVIQLLNSRLTSQGMKRTCRNGLLTQAMEPSRNTIFTHIRF